MKVFENARTRLKDWGWRRAVYWQFMHLLKRVFGLHIHYANVGADRDDLRDPNPPDVDPEFRCFIGGKEDLLPFSGKVDHLDEEFLHSAFDRGDECSITFYRGELVNYCFTSRSRSRVTPQIDVLIPEGFRYVYKEWTHPNYRRMNLAKLGSWTRRNNLCRPHSERSLSYVETHNYASLLHRNIHPFRRPIRMGFVGWINFFGYEIPFNSRKAKWIGFEFVRKEYSGVRQSF